MLKITTDTERMQRGWYYILGMYDHPTNTIFLNIPAHKRMQPRAWRRLLVSTLVHEFVHYLQAVFGHDFNDDNPYTRYVMEYQASVVDLFLLRLMKVPLPADPTPEMIALASIRTMMSFYMAGVNNVVEENQEEAIQCPQR